MPAMEDVSKSHVLCPFLWQMNLKNSLKLKRQKSFLEDTDEMESKGLPGSP